MTAERIAYEAITEAKLLTRPGAHWKRVARFAAASCFTGQDRGPWDAPERVEAQAIVREACDLAYAAERTTPLRYAYARRLIIAQQ